MLHVSSLPGKYGIGDLGPVAHQWVDCLADAGQQVWQILPLTPSGCGSSPYSSLSAAAGSPELISIEQLVIDGYLPSDDGFKSTQNAGRVDYARVIARKQLAVERAWETFCARPANHREKFRAFCELEKAWLDDFSLFQSLREANPGLPWTRWSKPLVRRDPAALSSAARDLAPRLDRHRFEQFLFFSQLDRLRAHARRRGIRLLGDVPIFVCADSVDVWANAHLFKLDRQGRPTVVAGVPPDYFSSTGQRWGNPIYDWEAMRRNGFVWWIDRFKSQLKHADLLRIDHFRGFAACWEIPAGYPTAARGRWVSAPGDALFTAVRNSLGKVPFVAEDLGTITPDVTALRDKFEMPGMRVLQFGFGGDPGSEHLPCNFSKQSVVYTGTHDNDTTRSWYATLDKKGRKFLHDYLGSAPQDVAWELLRLAWASVANCAIAPMQDLLSLGPRARMNTPNQPTGNWRWRMPADALDGDWRHRLAELTRIYGRSKSDSV